LLNETLQIAKLLFTTFEGMKKNPIGIFDSGYGGLTVMKEIVAKLPEYDYVYLGDNARAPYGPLAFETVYDYTLECVKWFFEQGCSLVILACNTASAKALRNIQQKDLPKIDPTKRVLGVIRPTSELLGNFTKTNHIGIMATQGTVASESYVIETNKFYPKIKVQQEACPEWVQLVETGNHFSEAADISVQKHLNNIVEKDAAIDCILLACTHYPLLIDTIKKYTPAGINIIQQGEIVAESLAKYLESHAEMEQLCSKNATQLFYTTGNVADFDSHASMFFGSSITSTQIKLG
jgi:glutamate racemase